MTPLQRSLDPPSCRHDSAAECRSFGETDVDVQVVGERDGRHNGPIALIIRGGGGGGARAGGPSPRPTGVPVI